MNDCLDLSEVYAIPHDGRYVVYAPLKHIAFICDSSVPSYLHKLITSDYCLSQEDNYLGLEFLKGNIPAQIPMENNCVESDVSVFAPTAVTLFLTNRCNLRCIYCYASAGSRQSIDMDFRTAKRAINFICRNALMRRNKSVTVGFHGGGEPTVNWGVLTQSLEYARLLTQKNDLELRTTLTTNGFISKEKCEWLLMNISEINVSVDGSPEIQNRQRPLASRGPSDRIVFRNLERIDKAGIPYLVRMTVTAFSVNDLSRSVDFLLERIHPKRIQVEPVFRVGRGKDPSLRIRAKEFVDMFSRTRKIAKEHGTDLVYSAADINRIADRFCQSCGEGFNLTPKGSVSACFEVCDEEVECAEEYLFGRFDDHTGTYQFDLTALRRLRTRSVWNVDWCEGCFCKWHCSGDCHYQARLFSGKGDFRGSPRCEITQALILDQILERISASKGNIWA